MKVPTMKRLIPALFGALALARAASGCAFPDTTGTVSSVCADRASFDAVSPFVEAGCGTIDCHGAPSRPLRVMGYSGLRLSSSDHSGAAVWERSSWRRIGASRTVTLRSNESSPRSK